MKRKITAKLLEWKENSKGRSALLLKGARRIGKSYIVEEFARSNYKSYILIDFNMVNDRIRDLFLYDINDLDDFFMRLSALYGTKLYERDSVIIFDEVQLFPRARSVIKYLVADGRYDYLETGSLISIKKNTKDILIPSEEDSLEMYPMDFEEFMWANDESQLYEVIKQCYEQKKEMGQALHRKAMNLFRAYMIVGGMPQAVNEYVSSKNFNDVDRIKRRILKLYREDIIKYADDYLKAEALFDEIPLQLSKENRHFKLASLENKSRYSDYKDALTWLFDAMIVNGCYAINEPELGMRLRLNNIIFKAYMADTGLLISHAYDENSIVSEEVYQKLLFDKLEVNMGMVMENVVAQMLRATNRQLYFYTNSDRNNKDNRMEIDFLVAKRNITNKHNISPIEVKSSKNYTLNSIRKFRNKYKDKIDKIYVLHTSDLRIEDDIIYLPLYMTLLL